MSTTSDSDAAAAPVSPLNAPAKVSEKVLADRKMLRDAQANGRVLSTYVKLSGPGWLQSAITLGGGTLAGSLFLGMLGGTSMLWLQLVAIAMGVVMLSAISYVTLSTGRRPFEAIRTDVNPALAWGWLAATSMANMIWCMPQFSLCYDALDKNLLSVNGGPGLGDATGTKWMVTAILFAAAGFVVLQSLKQGAAAKFFDVFLKALVGMIVICFFGVTFLLIVKGEVNFSAVLAGLIPDLSQLTQPTGDLRGAINSMSPAAAEFWTPQVVSTQRSVMIASAATAVGINMTFLLPYSMLARGWDKPFRGLAKFDLATGMAIPYVLVTCCVVIAAAYSFHNRTDEQLAAPEISVMQKSPNFNAVKDNLLARVNQQLGADADKIDEEAKLVLVAALPIQEKRVAASLIKRDAFQLSKTLAPLLGETPARLVFGLGVFGMGFSTIIILMLINGYVFREMLDMPDANGPFIVGLLVAGCFGAGWVWMGETSRFWLAIFASTFGAMLLPIAYITFMLMMNSRRILGDEMPRGGSRWTWNLLMGLSVITATVWAGTSLYDKIADKQDPVGGQVVLGILIIYAIAVAAGFFVKRKPASLAASS